MVFSYLVKGNTNNQQKSTASSNANSTQQLKQPTRKDQANSIVWQDGNPIHIANTPQLNNNKNTESAVTQKTSSHKSGQKLKQWMNANDGVMFES